MPYLVFFYFPFFFFIKIVYFVTFVEAFLRFLMLFQCPFVSKRNARVCSAKNKYRRLMFPILFKEDEIVQVAMTISFSFSFPYFLLFRFVSIEHWNCINSFYQMKSFLVFFFSSYLQLVFGLAPTCTQTCTHKILNKPKNNFE